MEQIKCGLAGVAEKMISLHEETAEITIWLMGITGIISLAAMFMAWKKHKQANIVFLLPLLYLRYVLHLRHVQVI